MLRTYHHFLQFIFTTIFIAACWNSISKFNEARIAVALQEIDIVDVQYPSVRSINMKKLFKKRFGYFNQLGFCSDKVVHICYLK